MTTGRDMLRRKAKAVYKENTKNIPKKKRIPFSQFFKQYKSSKDTTKPPDVEAPEQESEDFDFDNLVNVSEINDDDLDTTDEE